MHAQSNAIPSSGDGLVVLTLLAVSPFGTEIIHSVAMHGARGDLSKETRLASAFLFERRKVRLHSIC